MSAVTWMLKHCAHSILSALKASIKNAVAWYHFWQSFKRYSALAAGNLQPGINYLYPCISDNTSETQIEPTYFYQDAWAFEKIIQKCPEQHIDIGSHHKYVALLSKVISVTMVDIRPLSLPLDTLRFRQGSILALPFEDQTLMSVSSLCVVEHIGLGRYGDPLDPDGTEKAIRELKRVIARGGDLYLSLPLDDTTRIYFNAHRAFSEDDLVHLFEPFEIIEKRYIYGNNFGKERKTGFGTGCYHLRRA